MPSILSASFPPSLSLHTCWLTSSLPFSSLCLLPFLPFPPHLLAHLLARRQAVLGDPGPGEAAHDVEADERVVVEALVGGSKALVPLPEGERSRGREGDRAREG